MNPTELHTLFNSKEQSLLVSTEPARLKELSEDELDEMLTHVRRARNKYTKLYRRQSAASVRASSSRGGTSTSNQRTKRKAEIFENALARVSRSLSIAARATANELKDERLAMARAAKGTPPVARRAASPTNDVIDDQVGAGKGGHKGRSASASRQASRKSSGTRTQARRDAR